MAIPVGLASAVSMNSNRVGPRRLRERNHQPPTAAAASSKSGTTVRERSVTAGCTSITRPQAGSRPHASRTAAASQASAAAAAKPMTKTSGGEIATHGASNRGRNNGYLGMLPSGPTTQTPIAPASGRTCASSRRRAWPT